MTNPNTTPVNAARDAMAKLEAWPKETRHKFDFRDSAKESSGYKQTANKYRTEIVDHIYATSDEDTRCDNNAILGKFITEYGRTRTKREARHQHKKATRSEAVLGEIAAGATGVAAGAGMDLFHVSPVFAGAVLTTGGAYAAYVSKTERVSVKALGKVGSTKLDEQTRAVGVTGEAQSYAAEQLEKLGFEDKTEVTLDSVADMTTIRLADKSVSDVEKRVAQGIIKDIESVRTAIARGEKKPEDIDVNYLRVRSAYDLLEAKMQKNEDEVFQTERRKRGLGRAGIWLAGVAAGVFLMSQYGPKDNDSDKYRQPTPVVSTAPVSNPDCLSDPSNKCSK